MSVAVPLRLARPEELEAIWALVRRAVVHMNALGNPQWGKDYPTADFYRKDIQRGELWVAEADGALAGVACLNTDEAPEYAALPWTTTPPAVVLHRLAVDPAVQRRGVGRRFFAHAEALARQWGASALRMDTYCLNHRMQALIQSQGFRRVGEIHLHGRPLTYPCFEKDLGVS